MRTERSRPEPPCSRGRQRRREQDVRPLRSSSCRHPHVAPGLEEPQDLRLQLQSASRQSRRGKSVPTFATSIFPDGALVRPGVCARARDRRARSRTAPRDGGAVDRGRTGPPRRGTSSEERRAHHLLARAAVAGEGRTVTSFTPTARRSRSNERMTGDAITGSRRRSGAFALGAIVAEPTWQCRLGEPLMVCRSRFLAASGMLR